LGIFGQKDLPPAIQTDSTAQENLPHLTELAIECLSNGDKGFFLMVENEDIDESFHRRNIPQALYATRDLDLAVATAIKVLKKKGQLQETLLLVTADHDTGGLALNAPLFPHTSLWNSQHVIHQTTGLFRNRNQNLAKLSNDRINYKGPALPKAPHTATDVDLYAKGPGSEKVRGVLENTDIYQIMHQAMGLDGETVR